MAVFSRFASKSSTNKLAPVDDDDDDVLKTIAQQRAAPASKPPVKAPTVTNPVVKTQPRPVVQSQPVAAQAPVYAPRNQSGTTQTSARPLPNPGAATGTAAGAPKRDDLRLSAIERLDEEDNGGVSMAPSPYEKKEEIRKQERDKGLQISSRSYVDPVPEMIFDGKDKEPKFDPTDGLVGVDKRKDEPFDPGVDPDGVGDKVNGKDPTGDPLGGNYDPVTGDGGKEKDEPFDPGLDPDGVNDKENGRDVDEDLTDVANARIEAEQAKEREAQQAELAAGKAKALMMANARAQLAGMGLSGSTAALESDIGRTQDRSAVLAMSQLGRSQRDEGRDDRRLTAQETRADADAAFLAMQRKMAVRLLEEETGQDEDGDGLIGGLTQEQIDKRDALQRISDDNVADASGANAAAAQANMGGDGGDFSPYTGDKSDAAALKDAGVEFDTDQARLISEGGKFYVTIKDEDGKNYKFEISEEEANAAGQGQPGFTSTDEALRVFRSWGVV